ncbi:L,D-transpeptidase [Streptomyces sp. NPDC086554]|uniref:L,D-transpeptidase n=1 Tax=Streptomyces sp. NPDC086554 TaxID=3154864 RepID=UPI00343BFC64
MISQTVRCGLSLLLAMAAAIPAGSPAIAEPPPPHPAFPAAGVPLPPPYPWQQDTPDQALAPDIYTPSAEEDAIEPAPARGEELIESVPPGEVVMKKCPTRAYRVACVDLRRQLMWVQKGKRVLLGPVPVRSGRAGYVTRTGWHKVYWKHKNHWSSIYETPMPYSQFFDGGQAFHGIYSSIHNPPGSHGCVNLRLDDARRLWRTLHKGDRVYAWGRRPGT